MDVGFDYLKGGRNILSLRDREIGSSICFGLKTRKERKLANIAVSSDRVAPDYEIVAKNYAGTNINEDFDILGGKLP